MPTIMFSSWIPYTIVHREEPPGRVGQDPPSVSLSQKHPIIQRLVDQLWHGRDFIQKKTTPSAERFPPFSTQPLPASSVPREGRHCGYQHLGHDGGFLDLRDVPHPGPEMPLENHTRKFILNSLSYSASSSRLGHPFEGRARNGHSTFLGGLLKFLSNLPPSLLSFFQFSFQRPSN